MSSINSELSKYPGLMDRIEQALGTTKTSGIANLLKVSASLVSDWRAGRSVPGLPQLLEAARRGHTTVDWLLTGRGSRTLSIAADDEETELLNITERAFIEMAARRGQEPITRTLKSLIHDGLAARGHTPYAVDVIVPVLSCLDTFPETTRARIAELLVMALGARLRGRVQDWSLVPDNWQSMPDMSLKAQSASPDTLRAVRKLRQRLKSLSPDHTKGPALEGANMLIFSADVRMLEMPLVGEIAASGAVKSFRASKTAEIPDVFSRSKHRKYYLLRVREDSSAGGGIEAGTLLIYEGRHDVRDGQMVVAIVGAENTVKWLYHEGNRIRLESLNHDQGPIYVDEHQVDIKGVVVGIFRRSS